VFEVIIDKIEIFFVLVIEITSELTFTLMLYLRQLSSHSKLSKIGNHEKDVEGHKLWSIAQYEKQEEGKQNARTQDKGIN
jgi:hypothetical protein